MKESALQRLSEKDTRMDLKSENQRRLILECTNLAADAESAGKNELPSSRAVCMKVLRPLLC